MTKMLERRLNRHITNFEGESLTQQSHKKEVNVNTIVAKARKGIFPMPGKPGFFGDFTSLPDFLECQNRVRDAHSDFEGLPSDLRKRFKNDPALLIQFMSDPENRAEAEKLGLLNIVKPETPVTVPVTPETPETV